MMVTRIFAALLFFGSSTTLWALVANDVREQQAHKVVLRPQTHTMVSSLKGMTDATVTKRDKLSGSARLITIVPQQASMPLAERQQYDYKHEIHNYVQDSHRLLGLDLSELRLMPAATLINDDLALSSNISSIVMIFVSKMLPCCFVSSTVCWCR